MRSLPRLGVGLGYRPAIRHDIVRHVGELDFVEVIADHFFRNPAALQALASLKTCVPHSLALSVGSLVDPEYLEKVARVAALARAPFFTDHLAFTRTGALEIGHLAPLPFTHEQLDLVVENVRKVRARVPLPFALENVTMAFYWPNSEMPEHEFLCEVVRRTGCHLLLDLENVRVNCANHDRASKDFLDKLPLERVAQVHVAGGVHGDGIHHDSHSAPVSEETWNLLEYLVDVAPPPAVLIERDQSFPPFEELVGELRRARRILARQAS